jgi:hypothetical protein
LADHRKLIAYFENMKDGDKILCEIIDGKNTTPHLGKDEVIEAITIILSYIEDVGLLCRKRYVRIEDVNDIIGPSIVLQVSLSTIYISEFRRKNKSSAKYANAIWLYKRLRKKRPFQVHGFGQDRLAIRSLHKARSGWRWAWHRARLRPRTRK